MDSASMDSGNVDSPNVVAGFSPRSNEALCAAIGKTIAYAKLFQYPLTNDELRERLFDVEVDETTFTEGLKLLQFQSDPALFELRAARERISDEAIQNAQAFLKIQNEFGSFDAYMWRFVGGEPKRNVWKSLKEVPPRTQQSDAMSKDLRERGFKFVGSTICYAFMQAVGMVNDHTVDCFRHGRGRRG